MGSYEGLLFLPAECLDLGRLIDSQTRERERERFVFVDHSKVVIYIYITIRKREKCKTPVKKVNTLYNLFCLFDSFLVFTIDINIDKHI